MYILSYKITEILFIMRSKYSFVRGKPFHGIMEYNLQTIPVKNKTTTYPLQIKLFEEMSQSDKTITNGIHQFYVHLGTLIYGDLVQKTNTNGTSLIHPDSILGNVPKEIKSIAPGSPLLIKKEQTARYLLHAFNSSFPKRLRHQIYRHGLAKPGKNYRNKALDSLILNLSGKTKFHVSLPMSIISKLYFSSNKNILETDYPNPSVKVRSPAINQLLAEPKDFIREVGFEPSRFEINKYRYPKGTKINGLEINSFPILVINDLEYKKAKKDLLELLDESNPRIVDFIGIYSLLKDKFEFLSKSQGKIVKKIEGISKTIIKNQEDLIKEAGLWADPNEEEVPF